jgi:hypothetical protein
MDDLCNDTDRGKPKFHCHFTPHKLHMGHIGVRLKVCNESQTGRVQSSAGLIYSQTKERTNKRTTAYLQNKY